MLSMRSVSLARRFTLLSVLILAAVALPTVGLMQKVLEEQQFVSREFAGARPALALIDTVTHVQSHRLHSVLSLSAQADAKPARAAAEAATLKALSDIKPVLPDEGDMPKRLQDIEAAFKALAADVAGDKLGAREAFERHNAVLKQMDDLMAHNLANSGLLLDPEAANYFFIIAGFQEGKTVIDQLAQLHDLGVMVLRQKGATSLDLNQLAAVTARLEDRERFLLQNLELARDVAKAPMSPELEARLKATQAGVKASVALVQQTFLGMSPDWDMKPEVFSAKLQQAIQDQRTFSNTVVSEVEARLSARATQLKLFVIALGIVLASILTVLGWRLWAVVQAIIQPMAELAAKGDQMAEGDLTPTFSSNERNELGLLIQSLERMRLRWIAVLSQVQGSAREVLTTTQEMSGEQSELSQRTEQTAARLQETTHLVNQLQQDVQASAGAATEASKLAAVAAQVASRGGHAVSEVVHTMDAINERSRRIADITSVIDGIAFQTNILALNAAVESARAGEHGRGFAVVAAEVRTLAQRSASAAREIKSLINASGETIERGNGLAKEAGSTMRDIEAAVAKVNAVINTISEAATRQRHDIDQVHTVVADLDEMTQRNAAVAEQSAAASETLTALSGRLGEAVQQFKLPH